MTTTNWDTDDNLDAEVAVESADGTTIPGNSPDSLPTH